MVNADLSCKFLNMVLGSIKGRAKPPPNYQHLGCERSHTWQGEEGKKTGGVLSRGVSGISMWYKNKTSAPAARRPASHRSRLSGFQRNRRQTTRRTLGANVGASPGSGDNEDRRPNNFAPGLTPPRGSPRRPTPIVPGRSALPRPAAAARRQLPRTAFV